jgi:imidazolonepropionase-like amidohydrolase
MTRTVLHDAAFADGTSDSLRTGVSLAIEHGQIAWIRPNDSADTTGSEVVDAGGATIVPAMVDCHSHLTMQGGSHWIARANDPGPVCARWRETTRGVSPTPASCGRATSERR